VREQSFSFILKISLLDTSQSSEGGMVLRGSLRQVGIEETRYFVSFERLLELLEKSVVQPPPPNFSAQVHPEKAASEG
jgi:hypothetical protein